MAQVTVMFKLEEEALDQLRAEAEHDGIDIGAIIRKAVRCELAVREAEDALDAGQWPMWSARKETAGRRIG